jgi:autotransporter-associated beta strand protein
VGSGDAAPPVNGINCAVSPGQNPALYGTAVGAVQAVVPDPTNPNTIYVGAVNGGVWVTHDGGATWAPLMDSMPSAAASTSIASLVLDPTDPTHKTLLAGTGLVSNGSLSWVNPLGGSGGPRNGLLYTTDGGVTWSVLGSGQIQDSVVAAAAVGKVLLAGTSEVSPYASYTFASPSPGPDCKDSPLFCGGLWRSIDSGQTWTQITGPGTPNGPVGSIVVDPTHPNIIYVSVTAQNSSSFNSTEIWKSIDTGKSWSEVFNFSNSDGIINSSNQTIIKLAIGPNNTLAAGVVEMQLAPPTGNMPPCNPATTSCAVSGTVTGLFYSANGGANWTQLTLPTSPTTISPNGQAPRNFAIAIDPKNPKFVYVSGDDNNNGTTFTAPVFRINASTNTYSDVSDAGALNFSAVHADSRSLAFLPNGNLVLTGDGGIYARTQPQTGAGIWTGLNGPSVFETYAVAYDGLGRRLITAAQDGGVTIQSAQNSSIWNHVVCCDGTDAFVNDVTLKGLGYSVFYASNQYLNGASRFIIDQNGKFISDYFGAAVNFSQNVDGYFFSSPWIQNGNPNDPTLMALAGDHVYVTQDPLTDLHATTVNLTLTDLGNVHAAVTAMAYGTPQDEKVLIASTTSSEFWISTNAMPGAPPSLQKLAANNYDGGPPTSIVFDPNFNGPFQFYIADTAKLFFGTSDDSKDFVPLTKYLAPLMLTRPTSVEYISNNGVNALLVGGLSSVGNAQSPIAVADYVDDPKTGYLTEWRLFGQGLPNAQVGQLAYNSAYDVLAVGTWGRGVYTLYDVTSYFPQANVLQFGLADNDSMPDSSILTDGTVGHRPLIKYGTGTLTIEGDASYTGSTTVNGGTLAVYGSIESSSLTSVNSGGALIGTGAVGNLQINSGGVFAPGALGAAMTVAGNLAFQSGAAYIVQTNPTTASLANVSGTATLAGDVFASFSSNVMKQYDILHSGGLNGSTFEALSTSNLLPGFAANFGYTNTDVVLNLTAVLGSGGALNGNQQNVAAGLNNFFNNGGTLTTNFYKVFGLTGGNLANAMTQLSGEPAADAEFGAFKLTNQFLGLMLDPFVDGRSGAGWPVGGSPAVGFASKQQASYLPGAALSYAEAPATLSLIPAAIEQRWSVWGAGFGGSNTTDGDPAIGSHDVTASDYGYAAGVDYHISPDTVGGVALAGGGTNWGLAEGLGAGRSNAFQAGVYGATRSGPAYVAAAFAFANHWMNTNRNGFGGDQLDASFNGQNYAGRLEAGYRYAFVPTMGITPYSALQAQSFHTPNYGETDLNNGGFGLSYNAMTATDTRSELGARFDDMTMVNGMQLSLRARAAWAHDWVSNPSADAFFQALPGATFLVYGARPPKNSALASAGAELHITRNWSLSVNFDGEFASGSKTYAATGAMRYTW